MQVLRRLQRSLRVTVSIFAMIAGTAANAQERSSAQDPSQPQTQSPAAPTEVLASPPPEAESDGRLADIVVTAQRRSENLQDVPISVTAVQGEALAAAGVTNTADLPLVTPGVTFTNGVGAALPRIRGIGTAATGAGIENPVAVYVDGVYIASAASALTSLNNVQQLAVLKGPQGTLFGRNATGGLVQITTFTPSSTFSGNMNVGYGNRDTRSANLYVTGGLADGVAADLAIYYNDQKDGFGRNLFAGGDIGNARDIAVRTKLRWRLGSGTVATLALDYADTRGNIPAFRAIYGSFPINRTPYTGGPFDIDSDIRPRLHTQQGGAALTIEQRVGELRLTSISAYRRSSFLSLFDNDKLPPSIQATQIEQDDKQFSQELQLASGEPSKLQWVLGGFYFKASGAFDPVSSITPAGTQRIFSTQRTDSLAAYGQATYPIFEDTNLTAGLRYTTELRSLDARRQLTTPAGVVLPATTTSGDRRYTRVTWRVAIDQHFGEHLLGYLSYNRGFKSGGYNPQAFPAIPFEAEVLDAYEAGLKVDLFDRTVRLNGAAFYYDYRNIQISANVGGLFAIYNAASAKIYGADFDATIAATRNLTFTIGASALHHRFGDFPNAVISTPRPTGGNIISSGRATGNRLPLTPDWTLNLSANYTVPLPHGSLVLNASYMHSDGWAAEADNRLRQSSYDLLNTSLTWFLDSDERVSAKVWGKNLTNQVYAVQMNSSANVDGVAVAPGRTFGISVGYKF